MKGMALALALLLAAPCAGAAGDDLPSAGGSSPAVLALLEKAAEARDAGRSHDAAAALERALRIEPANAVIWHELARAHLELGDHSRAQAMAAKSHSLSGDRALLARNAELLATALQLSGRPPTSNELRVLASRGASRTEADHAPAQARADGDWLDDVGQGLERSAAAAAEELRVQSAAWARRYDGYADRLRREAALLAREAALLRREAARRAEIGVRFAEIDRRRKELGAAANELVRRHR